MKANSIFNIKILNILSAMLLVFSVGLADCSSSDDDEETALQTNNVNENATATITLNTGDSLSGTYAAGDYVEVAEDAVIDLDGTVMFELGSLLRILPGATIKSVDDGSLDYLIIKQGAKISAQGTAAKPITFTSGKPVPLTADWGGIVINGYAKINQGNGTAYGEGTSGLYGGNNDGDSSGTLKYVKVFYAGYAFNSEDELNGIALQGVGSGTTVDYVQLHMGKDDGIEMFGGAVNLKHIVSTANNDDQIDCTFGWRGKIQFAIAYTTNASDPDCAMEFDNNGDNNVATPVTNVTMYNMTVLSALDSNPGAKMREGTHATFVNSYFAALNTGMDNLLISQHADTVVNVDNSIFENLGAGDGLTIADSGTLNSTNITSTATPTTELLDPGDLTDLANLDATDFERVAGADNIAVTGATPPNDGFFDTTATFIGAVGTTNWLSGWTEFPQ